MPLTYPTFEELSQEIIAEFRTQLPSVDPTVFGTWALSFANGNAVLAQAIMFLVRDLEIQMFPQTATEEFLDQWGWYEDLARLSPTGSEGFASATGVVDTTIAKNTAMTGSNGIAYESTALVAVVDNVQTITGLGNPGGTIAYAETGSDHHLATGMTVVISGLTGASVPYNKPSGVVVTVTGRNWFLYSFAGGPSPAVGSPQWASTFASVPVIALETGLETNLGSGAQLTIDTPITDIDDTLLAQYDGLSGGASEETDEDYRNRIILSRSIREGVFTPDQIKLAVFSVNGNTRAWVKKPTTAGAGGYLDPTAGQCSVFFVRDNDANITPSGTPLLDTYDAVIADGSVPANMVAGATSDDADLFVQGPTLEATDFTFLTLSPDTPTMRTAVENTLAAFFDDTIDFEESVTAASYLGAIQNTQDLETGAWISTFSLSAPTTDITITAGQLATLGTVTWF